MTPDSDNSRLRHAKVTDALRADLHAGRWPTGVQLPGRKELAAEYHVAPVTLDKALKKLQEEGYLSIEHGRGTFVRDELPEAPAPVANYETISQRIDVLCETIEDLNRRVERLETQGRPPARKAAASGRSQRRAAPGQ